MGVERENRRRRDEEGVVERRRMVVQGEGGGRGVEEGSVFHITWENGKDGCFFLFSM